MDEVDTRNVASSKLLERLAFERVRLKAQADFFQRRLQRRICLSAQTKVSNVMSPPPDQLQKEERPFPKGVLFLLLPFGWMLYRLPDFIATLAYLWNSSLPWLGWFINGLAVIVLLCWYTFAGLFLMLLEHFLQFELEDEKGWSQLKAPP